jgi:hypothetical protein
MAQQLLDELTMQTFQIAMDQQMNDSIEHLTGILKNYIYQYIR